MHAAQHRPSGTHTHVHGGLGRVPGSGHTSHDHLFLALPLLVLGSREVTRGGRELPGLCPRHPQRAILLCFQPPFSEGHLSAQFETLLPHNPG